jgi:hypothetical protein
MGDGKPVHTARVVVGKPDKQTPILSKEMQEIVFNPYWNVPNSIKTEEIRPFLREEGGWFGGGGWNTAVLERHNLRVNIGGREVDLLARYLEHNDVTGANPTQGTKECIAMGSKGDISRFAWQCCLGKVADGASQDFARIALHNYGFETESRNLDFANNIALSQNAWRHWRFGGFKSTGLNCLISTGFGYDISGIS